MLVLRTYPCSSDGPVAMHSPAVLSGLSMGFKTEHKTLGRSSGGGVMGPGVGVGSEEMEQDSDLIKICTLEILQREGHFGIRRKLKLLRKELFRQTLGMKKVPVFTTTEVFSGQEL